MPSDHSPSQPASPAEALDSRKSRFQPVIQIELTAAKSMAPGKTPAMEATPKPTTKTAPAPADTGQTSPPIAMPLTVPSALAFRAWPKFKPVVQIPAPTAKSLAHARRWKLHGGRLATVLGMSALAVTMMMSFTLIAPQMRPALGVALSSPTRLPTLTPPAATVTRPRPTVTVLPSTTPDLAATQQAVAGVTLTAQSSQASVTANTQAPTLPVLAASATPLPTSFINQGALAGATDKLFDETFTPGGYWDTGDTPYAQREISDGQLHLHIKNIGDISWSFNGVSGDNFYVQAATTVSTCRAGDYYGIVFRVLDDSNFYMFGISCDGRYRVMLQKDGQFTSLINFTFSPDIVVFGGYNLLGVRAVNNQFSFYINDQLLASTTDDTFAGGRFGVFAKSFETPGLTVHFDDITAWNLKP